VLRGLKRRLDRLWEARRFRRSVHDSSRLRANFIDAVRAGLRLAGIDPATVTAMRHYEPGGFFAPRPKPPPEPPRSPVERLRDDLLEIVRRYDDEPFDLNKATPFELFAMYCFIPDAPGVTYVGPKLV